MPEAAGRETGGDGQAGGAETAQLLNVRCYEQRSRCPEDACASPGVVCQRRGALQTAIDEP